MISVAYCPITNQKPGALFHLKKLCIRLDPHLSTVYNRRNTKTLNLSPLLAPLRAQTAPRRQPNSPKTFRLVVFFRGGVYEGVWRVKTLDVLVVLRGGSRCREVGGENELGGLVVV
jgi:hypothetical protein